MEEARPSLTAVTAALMRAAHLLLDDEPKILRDELASRLIGAENEAALRTALDALQAERTRRSTPELAHSLYRYMRASMAMRQRYAEDELHAAIKRGVTQYVILGAGLDSFAYRSEDLAGAIQVFEVDYPATQQWKQTRLRDLHITRPPNLRLIPVDFEKQTLADGLRAGSFRPEVPAFFTWLGVTMYLTEEAIFTTLRAVASLASGSEIVFGYVVPEESLDETHRRMFAVSKAGGATRSEPWLSSFEPGRLAAQVRELGFAEVWNFGPEEANARYFTGRTDELRVPPWGHLMGARVGEISKSGKRR